MQLRIFYSSFPVRKFVHNCNTKARLTSDIKTPCLNKMKLFSISKNGYDSSLKSHFKKYCKMLSAVIKLTKEIHLNNLISDSKSKMRNTWSIITAINKQ
jgi:hypothetical protein